MIVGRCKDCINYRKEYLLCKVRQTQIMDGPIFCRNFEKINEEKRILEEILKQRDNFLHDTGRYPQWIRMSRERFCRITPAARDEGLLEIKKKKGFGSSNTYSLAGMDVIFDDSDREYDPMKVGGRTDE